MNIDSLRSTIEQNKKGLAIAGAAAVAGLALMNKKKGASSPPAGPASPAAPQTGAQYGLSSMPAIGGVYDSSSSDVYNAIQPQLESLGRMMEEIKSPIPVFTPGFYGRAGGHGLYQVDDKGNRDWLDMPEWLALTNGGRDEPKVTKVARDNQFWTTTKQVGTDGGTWQ